MNLKMVTDKKLWSVYVFPLWELLRLVFVCSCSAGSCDLFNNQRSLLGGFPGGASDRESTYQCRRSKRPVFIPWVRKIPWSRKWQPTPVFLPGKVHGQSSLSGSGPWGSKELDLTEHVCMHMRVCTHTRSLLGDKIYWCHYFKKCFTQSLWVLITTVILILKNQMPDFTS